MDSHSLSQNSTPVEIITLRGYSTPNQKLAYFVLYLKFINTFVKNNICTL